MNSSDKEYNEILSKLEGAPEEEIAKLAQKLREFSDDSVRVSLGIQQSQMKMLEKEEEIRN